jgi:hypothetical protein
LEFQAEICACRKDSVDFDALSRVSSEAKRLTICWRSVSCWAARSLLSLAALVCAAVRRLTVPVSELGSTAEVRLREILSNEA